MKKTDKEKITFYVRKENRKKVEEIINYLDNQDGTSSEKFSYQMNLILVTFHDLFIKTSKTDNFVQRLKQLKKIQSKDSQAILREINFLKRQQDILTYIALANHHIGKNGASYDVAQLESIQTGTDPIQSKLVKRIMDLLKQDIERSKTIKHSNEKNN